MKYNSILSVCLVAIVCASVALSAFAQTGEVYSLNVVGFQKVTAASNGLTMVSTPFLRSPNKLDDVVGAQLRSGKSQSLSDQIIVWVATNQAYARYWLKNTDSKWYTGGAVPELATNAMLDPNMGFWVSTTSTTNQTVVVSGDVVDYGAVTNRLVPGLNMVSYPFSSQIDINLSQLTNGKAGKSQSLSDQIILWNPTVQAYDRYWLKNTDHKWYTGGATPTLSSNVTVGGGRGFWYQNSDAVNFTWVEAKPYTL